MPEQVRIGIIGAGWPGRAQAAGCRAAGGFSVAAVADLIPQRRQVLMREHQVPREFADYQALLEHPALDAVSICLPNHLHAPAALAALKAGRHVLCELPAGLNEKEARQLQRAAEKSGRVLLYAAQRRFGPGEQAAAQAIEKGYAGDVYHARVSWTRTRAIPAGTGWYAQLELAGGGALIDLGTHMLDLGWRLLGRPTPVSVLGITQQRFAHLMKGEKADVEDGAFGLIRFEGGQSLELAVAWAVNQPPQQNGTLCRLHGDKGAVDVYTPRGAMLYRGFGDDGSAKEMALKPPKVVHYAALMRHFRQCITGKATASPGAEEGVVLARMIDAVYKSARMGRSVLLSRQ